MSKMSNIYSLYVFYKVCKTLNYKDVSEELNISTSSISQHIKKIETYFNSVFLIRTTKNIKLTHDGKAFFDNIKTGFETIEEGFINQKKRNITICSTSSIALDVIIPILNENKDIIDNLSLKHIDDTNNNEDFIVSYGSLPESNLYDQHLISKRDTLSLFGVPCDKIEKSKFISIQNKQLISDFEQWCRTFDINKNELEFISVFNIEQAIELLKNEIGILVINRNILLKKNGITSIPEVKDFKCDALNHFYLYNKKQLDPKAIKLKELIINNITNYYSVEKEQQC
ncbi:hypothetical protein C942_02452 [Photobacterium marinum]|uniref:HTH lysR-type domain-containing protein n=1 Tax=Photobacterium marinum TaxID=1056511 RepID=L8JA49_9GAMM|nr:LysR family transcriptional regulator [Photobacterium marinum]ELR64429.1 hypothetical protein C942_02452 [Photobacterium marinum]